MKRLIVCCDGTWNRPDQRDSEGNFCPTNVYKLAVSIPSDDGRGHEQRVYYHTGVGTRRGERFRGGIFGYGLGRNVRDAYRWLVTNYEPDDAVFVFGFSRGAYTARSLASMVRNCGVLRQEHADKINAAYGLYRDRDPASAPREKEATLFRRTYSHQATVHFIGVWDTVGAHGIPYTGLGWAQVFNHRLRFHDMLLSSTVAGAFQALAIDEKRPPFSPAIWKQQPDAPSDQTVEQVWFAGCHCDVGGGNRTSGLSDITLRWIAQRAHEFGLVFVDGVLYPWTIGGEQALRPELRFVVAPDPGGPISESRRGGYRLMPKAQRTIGEKWPSSEHLSDTALRRHHTGTSTGSYQPPNLTRYLHGADRPAMPVGILDGPDVLPVPEPVHEASTP